MLGRIIGRIRRKRSHGKSKRLGAHKPILGHVALAAAVCALTGRYLPFTNRAVLAVAAMFPYLAPAGPIALVLFVIARRWMLAGAAATVTAFVVATQAPLYRADRAPTHGVNVRAMTANLMLGRARADTFVESARARADLLAVQELTSDELNRLSTAGLDTAFPHRVVHPGPGASGLGLWSKFPISETRPIDGYRTTVLAVKIQIPGVARDPAVVVAHPRNPWYVHDWHHDISRLPATLSDVDKWAGGGAVIVAGDFNTTRDMRAFRNLLQHGYRDAAEQAGSGLTATFPGHMPWTPPILAIDHLLTLRCTATTAYTISIPGTDHRALVATIDIPQ
jgi:endonuclease/exonuclease/phosphatase (EEP) superfamily protein YafD